MSRNSDLYIQIILLNNVQVHNVGHIDPNDPSTRRVVSSARRSGRHKHRRT